MPPDTSNRGKANPANHHHDLTSDKQPTKSLLDCPDWKKEMHRQGEEIQQPEHEYMLGPFFREKAPYRAKISPPYEDGVPLIISGHVSSYDEKRRIPAIIDVWQADVNGHYDNERDNESNPPYVFRNRARVRCDEHGCFEFETVHPGPYKRRGDWHAPHIHFRIRYTAHLDCVTQLLFAGDPYIDQEPFRQYSEVIELEEIERNGRTYQHGRFDIVLKAVP